MTPLPPTFFTSNTRFHPNDVSVEHFIYTHTHTETITTTVSARDML